MTTKSLISLENFDGDHCVEVFMRDDGSFGFEEYRRDPEDLSGWYPLCHFAHLIFNTKEDALTQAKSDVAWLATNNEK